ncbi:MurR/RpiR family transcriptional regulator [Peribacillus sp. SCS-155]|uniref:MurR/RpiR family transcriptional regulator n=1 Tax=Peribacillus sedimenti TaxID=3115297 RepID=UPI0039068673
MEQLFKLLVKEKFPHLSAGQKKVATYLVDNLEEAAFKTAFQIGRKAQVSETTVIRLSYALGFQGFSQMQEKIQEQLIHHNKTGAASRGHSGNGSVTEDTFTRLIESQVHILEHLLDYTNVQDIWKAVDALIAADQILIAGHRISNAAANWLSHSLSSLRENVSLCSPAGDFFEKLCNLTERSVVVVISFPRYAKETFKIAECAKQQGITLLSVTDRLLSPVGRISDITLTTEENAESGTNSTASVISLLELVIAGIHERDEKRIQLHQQKLEKLYSENNVFIE